MRIAVIAPLTKPVSPDARGGRVRLIYDLTEELVRRGHDVTIFTTGDSKSSARIIPVIPASLAALPPVQNEHYRTMAYLVQMNQRLIKEAGSFDIIHNNGNPEFFPMVVHDYLKVPMVTTVHIYMTDILAEMFRAYPRLPLISVSKKQQAGFSDLPFHGVVYPGINLDDYPFSPRPTERLLFFGRMNKYINAAGKEVHPKGAPEAIRVAKRSGIPLTLAGNVLQQSYFDTVIQPELGKHIDFYGPVDAFGPVSHEEKIQLYGRSKGLLFPLQTDNEASGVVMIEAMACGTPVVAYRRAAVEEFVLDGVTGFVVESEDEMVEAVLKLDQIDRRACRRHVEEHFTSSQMASSYEKIYRRMIQ